MVQDLVRPGAADARDQPLVTEEGVQPARVGAEDLAELARAQAIRLRPDVRQLLLDRLRRVEPDLGALLRAGLGEDERAAVIEGQAEGRRLRLLVAVTQEAKPPRAHEVDMQDELAVLGRQEDVLRAPLGTGEAAAFERGERRVVGLEGGDVRRARLGDREGAHRLVERAAERFDLRELRHLRPPGTRTRSDLRTPRRP